MLDNMITTCNIEGMNKLPLETRVQILSMLCEGSSMRSISRVCDVSINTVTKMLVDAGKACAAFHDARVRGLKSARVQVDEIWSFVGVKEANLFSAKTVREDGGDVWTWTAIDADTKLIATYLVGDRDYQAGRMFMEDLKSRLANRVQLTSDGHKTYFYAVQQTFGDDVDYAQLHKIYGSEPKGERRYSPAVCLGIEKKIIKGNPDEKHISTSFVERQNLTMRMHMRRFTRLTNGFSKKFENHVYMVALYTVWYNFVKQHKTLKGLSPAMAAGVSDKLLSMADIAQMVDATLPKSGKRGPYKKQHVIPAENSN
jgi:IS1 family transposase